MCKCISISSEARLQSAGAVFRRHAQFWRGFLDASGLCSSDFCPFSECPSINHASPNPHVPRSRADVPPRNRQLMYFPPRLDDGAVLLIGSSIPRENSPLSAQRSDSCMRKRPLRLWINFRPYSRKWFSQKQVFVWTAESGFHIRRQNLHATRTLSRTRASFCV